MTTVVMMAVVMMAVVMVVVMMAVVMMRIAVAAHDEILFRVGTLANRQHEAALPAPE